MKTKKKKWRQKKEEKDFGNSFPTPIELGNFPSMLARLEVYSPNILGFWIEGPHEGTLEIWCLMQRTVVLLLHTVRHGKGPSSYWKVYCYSSERVLLCRRAFLLCSLCCHITRPGPGLPQVYGGQPILLPLEPNPDFSLGNNKFDIQVRMLTRQ